jgi:MoaA/NifB/PqqE/SkfB family radical SAM enzyme
LSPLPIKGLALTAIKHPRYFGHLVDKKIRFARRCRQALKEPADAIAPEPIVYRLNLTEDCNLRCGLCMHWGETGWQKRPGSGKPAELSWEVVEKVLGRAGGAKPSLILNGGEPLMHPRFGELARELKKRKLFSTVCTNGTLLDRHEASFADNPYTALLVSLDGLEAENRRLRGEGVYEKAVENIRRLKKSKKPPYIGVQFTVQPGNEASMREFAEMAAGLGADWLLFNLRWFVTDDERSAYAGFLKEKFGVEARSTGGYARDYPVDSKTFAEELAKIRADSLPMQVSCYLKRTGQMWDYAASRLSAGPCLKQWIRMDVLADGRVTPCALYPDLTAGDLNSQSVEEAWNSPVYRAFRKEIRQGPISLCAKCDACYLYDPGRKYL